MQLQYYIYFLQSHEYSIWPFDLGLTYIFSLNLSNISVLFVKNTKVKKAS